MNKHSLTIGLVFAVLASGVTVRSTFAQEADMATAAAAADKAGVALVAAEQEVEKARAAIESGKELIARIPEDSPLMSDVAQVVQAASDNWKIAVESLKGAKESAAKITAADNEEVANAYALLAEVNAGVALSGAKVVQISICYIGAIADNKTESLDIIRTAMQDALASSSQVQFNYERVKEQIVKTQSM